MAKTIKLGNVILCDYVARGENNKHILLNVYSGDVLFTQFPPVVAFGLYIEYFLDTSEKIGVTFVVKANGDNLIEGATEFGPTVDGQYAVLAIQQFPLTLSGADTTLEVWLSAPEFRAVRAIQKRVRKLTQSAFASAMKPPSARSRSARKTSTPQP
jgi:hypothetical protein